MYYYYHTVIVVNCLTIQQLTKHEYTADKDQHVFCCEYRLLHNREPGINIQCLILITSYLVALLPAYELCQVWKSLKEYRHFVCTSVKRKIELAVVLTTSVDMWMQSCSILYKNESQKVEDADKHGEMGLLNNLYFLAYKYITGPMPICTNNTLIENMILCIP